MNLIWKFLRAGILVEDENGKTFIGRRKYKFYKTYQGTPQGGIASPVLANIYLHEFDMFIESLRAKHFLKPKTNRFYARNEKRMAKYRKALKTSEKGSNDYRANLLMLKRSKSMQDKTDSVKFYDVEKNLFGLRYTRYADDWILGIKGNITQAKYVYDECLKFFKETLKLEWNTTKSYLSRSYDQPHEYLGINVVFVKPKQIRYKYVKVNSINVRKRVVPKAMITFVFPTDKILTRLYHKGLLKKTKAGYDATHLGLIIGRDDYEIGLYYQSIINGINNYYRFVHNIKGLNRINHLLGLSCARTLASKYKSSVRGILKKYGKPIKLWRGDRKKSRYNHFNF